MSKHKIGTAFRSQLLLASAQKQQKSKEFGKGI
jgi:hypothetical protein